MHAARVRLVRQPGAERDPPRDRGREQAEEQRQRGGREDVDHTGSATMARGMNAGAGCATRSDACCAAARARDAWAAAAKIKASSSQKWRKWNSSTTSPCAAAAPSA